ncbi:MAG: PKD domain-containing protein [Flavobacteriales bacterium]|nr:PKD domain-containing protein [Flavobacteriales bacterium]MDG1779444.1 PKD domain-containing protein [Flavobacteriales bacterium]
MSSKRSNNVMNEDKRIQDLLSEKMHQASAPVDPAIWQGIQSALPAAGAGSVAAASGFKLGAVGWAAIATAVIGISTAVVVFIKGNTPPQEQTVVVQPEKISPETAPQTPSPLDEQTPVSSEGTSATTTTTSRVKTEINEDPIADTIEWEATAVQTDLPLNGLAEIAVQNGAEVLEEPVQEDSVEVSVEEEEAATPVINPDLTGSFTTAEDPFEDFIITFTPDFKQGAAYFWIFGDGTTSYEMSPVHQFEEEGVYDIMLNVTDEKGFSKLDELTLTVRKPALLILPNTFTPNGDGYNDFLNPAERSQNVTILSMQVYSLDGKLLFEQVGDGIGWDGNVFGGEPAQRGDYILKVSGKTQFGENINKQRKVFLQRN